MVHKYYIKRKITFILFISYTVADKQYTEYFLLNNSDYRKKNTCIV